MKRKQILGWDFRDIKFKIRGGIFRGVGFSSTTVVADDFLKFCLFLKNNHFRKTTPTTANLRLKFADGQTRATLSFEIMNDDDYEKAEDFYVELSEPQWHVKDPEALGQDGADGRPLLGAHKRCKVTITEDKEFRSFVDKMLVEANTSLMVGSTSWKQQWVEAWEVEDIDGGEF